MKRLKGEEVIRLAQEKGITITYKKRVEGGYRIKSINGVKYAPTLSEGMNVLRKMVSAPLSRKQMAQRKVANPTFALTKTELRAFKTLNRLNKSIRHSYKKKGLNIPKPEMYAPIKPAQAKKTKKFYKDDYINVIKNSIWHKSGIAYKANVKWFAMQLEKIYGEGDPLINALKEGKIVLSDGDLMDLHQILYSETVPPLDDFKKDILKARRSAKKLIKLMKSI